MPYFGHPKVSANQRLADFARVLVRAGTLERHEIVTELAEAAQVDVGAAQPHDVAQRLMDEADQELREEQRGWPEVTDYDRLQSAFANLRAQGVAVLESVEDHWRANERLTEADEAGEPLRGVVWFTPPDIWHAVEHGMLEINAWHRDSANIADGDQLLDDVVDALGAEGLDAHFDEGRIEVDARWQRRLV